MFFAIVVVFAIFAIGRGPDLTNGAGDPQNVALVIATKVLDGVPGPPRVVAAQFWN